MISVSFAALTNADNKWDFGAAGVASVVLMIEWLIECWEHTVVVSVCTIVYINFPPLIEQVRRSKCSCHCLEPSRCMGMCDVVMTAQGYDHRRCMTQTFLAIKSF